jgi:hypothetical protein
MFKATGKTYEAKEMLKEVGFAWDKDAKAWTAESYDTERWEKLCSPAYSRKSAHVCQAVDIVNI